MSTTARPRILFVDDEIKVLEGLSRALRAWQGEWNMVFHHLVEDCLTDQERQPYDVAVVDIRMPVMSGLDLIRQMNAIHPGTLSLVLTGATDIATAAAAINEANVFRFYTKPCAADVLAAGISQALAEARQRLAQQASSAEAAVGIATLNRLPTGVIVVDIQPRVVFTNKLGAEYLAAKDGLSLGPTGLCRTGRTVETAELHRLVKAAVEGGDAFAPRALSVTREDEDRPLSLVIAPLPTGAGAEPVAVLLVSSPERQTLPSMEIVSKLFDLTDAEARLALALAEGQRIEDAADLLGITLSSARTYLKRVFSKTEVTRQAELVRLILAAPSLLDLGTKAARSTGGPNR
jgi:DNA-binding NarL/FixJ family response regulator